MQNTTLEERQATVRNRVNNALEYWNKKQIVPSGAVPTLVLAEIVCLGVIGIMNQMEGKKDGNT